MENGYSYDEMLADCDELQSRYNVKVEDIGKSLFGRRIVSIQIGCGEKAIVYIGAHHGMESITSALLMKFAFVLCERVALSQKIATEVRFVEALEREFRFILVPMLNPDGVSLAVCGLDSAVSVLKKEDRRFYREQLLGFNGESGEDFSRWQANGRGVDLNHNYSVGFSEYKEIEQKRLILGGAPTRYSGLFPESEPESIAICRLLRRVGAEIMLTFHSQGEELYGGEGTADTALCGAFGCKYLCSNFGSVEAKNERFSAPVYGFNGRNLGCRRALSRPIGRFFEKCSGYKIATPVGSAAYGGLTDWHLPTFNKTSYTVEVGKGENPLPMSDLPAICNRLFYPMQYLPFLV